MLAGVAALALAAPPLAREADAAVLSVPAAAVPEDRSAVAAEAVSEDRSPVLGDRPAVPGDSEAGARPGLVARMRDRIELFPYGWVRTDATYFSAGREGFSNLSLSGARIGGGVVAGPVTGFVTIEAANAKGPQLFDAFVQWTIVAGLRLRGGQFKAPFGYRFNAPDLVDELPRAPLSLQAATPGRQVGLELAYDFRRYVEAWAAVFSGIGQNREANNTKIAFAGKLELRPLAGRGRGPQLLLSASLFAYHRTNGFTPTVTTALGFDFLHGIPAAAAARRVAAAGGLFWRWLSVRGEYFYTSDRRERDTDGDPFTPGEPLPTALGAGGYGQIGAVVTGQTKDPATLLPTLASARVRDSAVELSLRFERFRVGARDVAGNGIMVVAGGVNWVLLRHLRIYAAGIWQRLEVAAPEIPGARSWGVMGGLAGFFLRRAGRE